MKTYFTKIVFVFAFSLFIIFPFVVFAGTEHNMSGWAWSSNIGWISFNSTDTSSTIDYGVSKNSDGTLVGYAWSSSVGWIKFGGLSGFPSGTGTQAQNANINGTNLKGWARACSGTINNDCNSASRTDGWDGWISLSGATYGINYSGNGFTGLAWGSDVLGWLSFYNVITGPSSNCQNGANNSPDCNVCTTPFIWDTASSSCISPSVPAVTITADPNSGTVNDNVNPKLTWSATNNPTSCTASGSWSGTKAVSGTDVSQGVLTTEGTYTYTLTCSNVNGAGSPTSAIVTISPVGTDVSGVCGTTHYLCSAGTSTHKTSRPSRWTWICAGSGNGTDSLLCSENKTPIYIQN